MNKSKRDTIRAELVRSSLHLLQCVELLLDEPDSVSTAARHHLERIVCLLSQVAMDID